MPLESLLVWDPKVDLGGIIRAPKITRTVQTNVKKFTNYYQRKAFSTFFERIDANGNPAGLSDRFRFPGDLFIRGNHVTENLHDNDEHQYRVDTHQHYSVTTESRDRIESAYDRARELAPANDPDPLVAPGDPEWRLAGSGVNHNTISWYAYRLGVVRDLV